jgi:hypothetical protein
MSSVKSFLFSVVLILSFGWGVADEDADLWVTFGKGEDQQRFANCFIISFPSSFIIDPLSGISPNPNVGDLPIPEENLHTIILHDDKRSLEVRASSYGFLTEEFYTLRGFASPREVILTDLFRNALTATITRKKEFDLFYSGSDSNVVAVSQASHSVRYKLDVLK